MPVPIACPVALTPEAHARLESLVRAHSPPQALALRGRLILRAAAPKRPSHLQGATQLAGERHTVGRWRQRSLAYGRNGLQAAPRAGRPRRLSPLCACEGAGHGDQATGHLSLSRHPGESGRLGRRAPSASAAAHASLQPLASLRGGRPQAPSEWRLAQQPRSRWRSQSVCYLSALSPGVALLPGRPPRQLCR